MVVDSSSRKAVALLHPQVDGQVMQMLKDSRLSDGLTRILRITRRTE